MIQIKRIDDVQKLEELRPLGDGSVVNVNGAFMSAMKERLEFLTQDSEDNILDDGTFSLFALRNEDELASSQIVVNGNINDEVEFVERSFVYFTNDNGDIVDHKSFLHFNFLDQDFDRSDEYVIQEDLITNKEYLEAILPHVDDVYNEQWEKDYHASRLIDKN